jgi:hypothetical protein
VPRFLFSPWQREDMPQNTLSLIDWAIAIAVPLLVGYLVSKYLEDRAWFQELGAKNVVIVAACALLGFALDRLKAFFIASPDALAVVDSYVKPFMSILAMYLATQVTHGARKAKRVGLSRIDTKG